MSELPLHALRRPLAEELHARPFAQLVAPAQMMHFAFAPESGAASRDPLRDLAHLNELLSAFDVAPLETVDGRPPAHFSAEAAGLHFRWERHTEFVTMTITARGAVETPFDGALRDRLPSGWLERAPGPIVAAILVHLEQATDIDTAEATIEERLADYFDGASAARSALTDRLALAMGDFRVDQNGFTRFAILATDRIGPRRLGRIAQRLLEIETYRTMAMLALPEARRLSPRLSELGRALSVVVDKISAPQLATLADDAARQDQERATFNQITELAADLERMKAKSVFRFDAARAYEALVWDRLTALREDRIGGQQLFEEFMVRRFKPALRTCHATMAQLDGLSDRVSRAANLLRTRIDVSLEAQNQKLLASMDRRAQLQLRLQETVEGLSVVAISYYAVSLAGYAVEPLGAVIGLSAKWIKALLVAPIVFGVWTFVRRLRKKLVEHDPE